MTMFIENYENRDKWYDLDEVAKSLDMRYENRKNLMWYLKKTINPINLS
jgi:hypothetical protein